MSDAERVVIDVEMRRDHFDAEKLVKRAVRGAPAVVAAETVDHRLSNAEPAAQPTDGGEQA